MVPLPDEIASKIILSAYGLSPMYSLDILEELARRSFLRNCVLVSRQFHAIAEPLLYDSVIIETVHQASCLETGVRFIRKITIHPDFSKSGLGGVTRDAQGVRAAWMTLVRKMAWAIVQRCRRLVELRAEEWIDLPRLAVLPTRCESLVFSRAPKSSRVQAQIEQADSIKALTVLQELRTDNADSTIPELASARLTRLQLGSPRTAFQNTFDQHCFAVPAVSLRHLELHCSFVRTEIKDTLAQCIAITTLTIRARHRALGNTAAEIVEAIMQSVPASLRHLDIELDVGDFKQEFHLRIDAFRQQLQIPDAAPGLRLLVVRDHGSETSAAFRLLVHEGARRGVRIELQPRHPRPEADEDD